MGVISFVFRLYCGSERFPKINMFPKSRQEIDVAVKNEQEKWMKLNKPKKDKKNKRYQLLLQDMKETQVLLTNVKNELEKQVQLSNTKKDKT